MDIPPQPAATSTPDVLVLTRVVAAGVVEHENKTGVKEKFLRASLCLLPAPDPNPCNSPGANPNGAACTAANPDPSTWGPSDYSGTALKVSLQNWPEEIENHLKDGKVTLSVLPIAATSTNGSILPNNLDAAVKTEWDCVIPSRSQTINSVNRLWQQLMAPTTNPGDASVHDPSRKILTTYRTYYNSAVKAFHDPWAQLKIALAHSLAGTQAQSLVASVPSGGAAATAAAPAPNVMSVPHATAARALSALRAFASINTVYVNDQSRHPTSERAVFNPTLGNVRPVVSKLGLLASGATVEQRGSLPQNASWQSKAVRDAMRRTTLLGSFVGNDEA